MALSNKSHAKKIGIPLVNDTALAYYVGTYVRRYRFNEGVAYIGDRIKARLWISNPSFFA